MPRGDQTGPMGQGPRTGRGAGKCSGSDVPGFVSAPGGRGMGGGGGRGGGGRGRGGGGRGRRNMFRATGLTGWQRGAVPEGAVPGGAVPEGAVTEPVTEPVTPPPVTATELTEAQEIELLKAQANDAAAKFEQIQQRIDELAAGRSRDSASE